MAAGGRPKVRAALYLAVLGAFFFSSYGLANWAAGHRGHVPSIVFSWERHIPFLPWTIVPYWSIDVLYCVSFFLCRTRAELDRHAKRLLTAQAVAVAVFFLFPLRFAFTRPITHGLTGGMFRALGWFDAPFNQAPSLHLSFAVILGTFYASYFQGPRRWLVGAWFALIGVSALTTYQHHFIDIPTGAWLGAFCWALFPGVAEAPAGRATGFARYWKIGALYAAGGTLLAVVAFRFGSWAYWLLWPAGSCAIVAAIYWAGDPALFRKRNGTQQMAMWWLLAPYTAAAWLNSRWWTYGEPAAVEIADGVWIGRLPGQPLGFQSLVDLTAELSISTDGIPYRNVPVLDLTAPAAAQLEEAVAAIEEMHRHRPTLVCCALGYSRSAAAVTAWLVATGRAESMDDAVAAIERRRRVVLPLSATASEEARRQW